LKVPSIYFFDENVLILEYIYFGKKIKGSSFKLGKGLAQLHSYTDRYFGLEYDNYIGKNIQKNTPQLNHSHFSWGEFYFHYRIKVQLEICSSRGLCTEELKKKVNDLEEKLKFLINDSEIPSLLHGDLWNGNIFFDESGSPCIVDPAIYFGHREAEFGMITLFGGFDSDFFAGYMETFPLKAGWEERVKVYQLYHLLNHLNLVGNSYYNSIIELLNNLNLS
jgi:fructosamine-3-kinase